MDFLDPKKRKAHRIKLFIGYAMMAVALTFASVILLYQSYGYDIDLQTGHIVQKGLVFLGAHPDSAEVILNGKSKGRTDARLDIRAGDYNVELRADGYRSWKRSFTLEGGKIERFVYPFLFPVDLKTSDVRAYAAQPGMVTQSPDRKLVLIQQPSSYESFDLIDVSSKTASTTTVTVPTGVMTASGTTHTLEATEWSADNRRLVLKHTFDGAQEFILVDTATPAASVNLTKTLKGDFTAMSLRDKKYDQYFLYNSATQALTTATLKEPTSVLYQSDVLAYHAHGDSEVVFVTTAGAPSGKVLVKVREGSDSYTLRQLPIGNSYLVDIARFNDSWYVGAGTVEDQRVFLFKNPVAAIKNRNDHEAQPLAVLRTPSNPEFLSFSTNARFIASQAGNNFAVYDAETGRQYRYDIGLDLPAGQKATWMDGHRLTAVINGKTQVFDYDGINLQSLTDAVNGTVPLFDNNYEALFTVSPSVKNSAQTGLVRTELKVNR